MQPTKEARFHFEVKLHYTGKTSGLFSSPRLVGAFPIGTPVEFGGQEGNWTPEHYFMASLSGCFMTTYLSMAHKMGFSIAGLSCPCNGEVGIVDGRLQFIKIDLSPTILITDETNRSKATLALEKTHKYCLIANAINVPVNYDETINVVSEDHPGIKLPDLSAIH